MKHLRHLCRSSQHGVLRWWWRHILVGGVMWRQEAVSECCYVLRLPPFCGGVGFVVLGVFRVLLARAYKP